MAPVPSTPRRTVRGRPRGRPRSSTTPSRAGKLSSSNVVSEPPPKRRRYIPGGPGGGGRFVYDDGVETPADRSGTATAPRARASAVQTPVFPTRERSTRTRTAVNRDDSNELEFSSAAAVAAAVVQSEGYKPREERGWEEFHPNLDTEATFMIFHAEDVDGIARSVPPTPAAAGTGTPTGPGTPSKDATVESVANTPSGQGKPSFEGAPGTPTTRRRIGRPPRDAVSLYGSRIELNLTPKAPKVLPIHNQTPKERLDLKLPSYRRTDRIALFESKTFGQARYVDKSMMNVGYQESDNFIRPDRILIKANDANVEEDIDQSGLLKPDVALNQPSGGAVGRVEYDMDEQDDMWLEKLNTQRRATELDPITREIFEITITKIEKEWHALEKRIPKPNPKPPQTHRPRSSSAAAVNGELAGEEQDSKCAICDDGDCENTNAIVFCDGCDLAVHQECYGVPFIPEGQWMCRKCQLIGRGIPTCIFCPNTDGAFKQTNSSKWAHLLCAMWIPEVSLGNHTFMEPVMEVEKVPRNRWKLNCYICNQRMGASIQCGNKNCYQAFHVTCARRARLYLKMKNSQGALAVLDGSMVLKAFCDKHCPQDYAKENSVVHATREAKRFYKRTMKGRIWADSQASALQLAATHRHAITEHPPDESQMTGARVSAAFGDKKKGQPGKPIWKLPSGAPIIPQAVFDIVESALSRFPIRKRKEYVAEACRYWTLKREARRGAALLKRLQLQMETFSSMELTRRNFAAMGPSGKTRLARRIEFAKELIKELEQLKNLSDEVVHREAVRLEEAEMEQDFVDSCYFPIYKLLVPVIEKAFTLDKNVFKEGLSKLQDKLDQRFYTTTLSFAHDLCEVIHVGINADVTQLQLSEPRFETVDASPTKSTNLNDTKDRKRLGKRILRSVQPILEAALAAEADVNSKPLDTLVKELDGMLEASLEVRQPSITVSQPDANGGSVNDVVMVNAEGGQIIVADQLAEDIDADADGDIDVDAEAEDQIRAEDRMDIDTVQNVSEDSIDVITAGQDAPAEKVNGAISSNASVIGEPADSKKLEPPEPNGISDSPPSVDGYASVPAIQVPHPGPLTPPQSNGSFGRGPTDVLNEGGTLWYLQNFELEGTSALEEQWTGREAVRSLSEELTDMDDEALRDLEFDVDDDTITASPVNAEAPTASSTVVAVAVVSKKKSGSATKFRKGMRSSARRR